MNYLYVNIINNGEFQINERNDFQSSSISQTVIFWNKFYKFHSFHEFQNKFKIIIYRLQMEYKLYVLIYILVLVQSRKPYSTLKELTLTSTYDTSPSLGIGRRNILDDNFLYMNRANGNIQKRDFSGALLGIFQDPIVAGQNVICLEIYKEKLISIYQSGLIIVWNKNTLVMLNNTAILYTPGKLHYYLKAKDKLIMSVKQKMSFLQFDIQKMQVTSVFLNSYPNIQHCFAISPNERTIIDWQVNSTSIRIYDFSSNSLLLFQQYFQDFSSGSPESNAVFSSDSRQIIFTYKAGLRFHYIQNNYAPSKQVQFLADVTDMVKCVIFFNEAERTFLVSSTNQTTIYDEVNNESVSFSIFSHKTDALSKDRRYILQYDSSNISISKISCKNGYFYDNETGFCYPCWINNCYECDGDTGKCLTCINGTYYVNQQGICYRCSNYCLSCQYKTGACKECQSPYQLNSNFQCDLQSNMAIKIFQISVSIISSTKIYRTSLIMSFINQLQLYNYHYRQYGNQTLLYVKPTNIFQVQKLSLLSQQKLAKMFRSIRTSSSYENFTKNEQFRSQTSLDYGFWNASFLFFVQLVPLSFLLYILFKIVFQLLFNYQISKYVRQYSFYLFIMPCLFGNHVEYLSYTAANQLQSMMYMTIWDKFLLIFFLLFLFFFFIYLVAFPFLILIFHKKKTKKYFFDDSLPNLTGSFAINIFTTYKSFILSIIQSFMFQTYVLQMCLMIGVQLLVIFLLLIIEKKWKCFDKKSSFACFLVHQFLMILLNIVLIIDYQYRLRNDNQAFVITDGAAESIIWFIGLNIIINTIMAFKTKSNKKNQHKQEKSQTSKQQILNTKKRSSFNKSVKSEGAILPPQKESKVTVKTMKEDQQQQEKSYTPKLQILNIKKRSSLNKSVKSEGVILPPQKESNNLQTQIANNLEVIWYLQEKKKNNFKILVMARTMKETEQTKTKEEQKTKLLKRRIKEIHVKYDPNNQNHTNQMKNMHLDNQLKNQEVNSPKKRVKEIHVKHDPNKNNLIITELMKQEDIIIEQQ